MKKWTVAIAFVLFAISTSTYSADAQEQVKRFVDAFNERNLNQMLELVAVDMKWMSVSGENISTETNNHSELKQAMLSYFESTPSAKSKILSLHLSGDFVYSLEKASWQSKGLEKNQCSMAIYQFSAEKIQYVWYFQSHNCS